MAGGSKTHIKQNRILFKRINVAITAIYVALLFTEMYFMNSMKLVIPLHSLYWSIHTKDESKHGTAFAFIFGVN